MHLRRKYGLGMAPSPLLSLTAARSGGGGGGLQYGFLASRDEGTTGDLFVAPPASGGSDSNPGTFASPKATISGAMSAATAGQEIKVRAGTYRETVSFSGKSGTSGNRTTVSRYGTEEVIITAADVVTGWTQCVVGDEPIVGPNWANIYKKTVTTASIASGNPRAAFPFEAGVRMRACGARLPGALHPDNETAVDDFLTADETVVSGGLITGYRLPAVTDLYTQAQIERCDVVFHCAPNVGERTTVASFDTGTKTINLTNVGETYESNDDKDKFALLNLLPNMKVGEWGYSVSGSDTTLYIWPSNVANLTSGIEISVRGRCVDFTGTGSHCEIRGLTLQRASSGGASTDGLYAVHGGTSTQKSGLVVDNCLIRDNYRANNGYGAIWFGLVDDWRVTQTTVRNAFGQFGLFCQGSLVSANGMADGGRLNLCLIENTEQSPIRMYGQTNCIVSNTRIRSGGLAAHANKANFYEDCHRAVFWALDFAGSDGYLTWQQSSSVVVGFCNVPAGYSDDGRAINDQNNGESPATVGAYNGDSYILNNISPPYRDGRAKTNGMTLGKTDEPNVLYTGKNNIVHGASVVLDTRLMTNGWRYNMLTSGSALAASSGTDVTADPDDIYTDLDVGNLTIKSGSPSRTATTADISADIAVLEGWFPDFDFRKDITGTAYDPADPPMGPWVNPSSAATISPIWVERPSPSGTPAIGNTLTATGGYLCANPFPTWAYQWVRSTDLVTWSDISGQTGTTYVVQAGDDGYYIGLRTAANGVETLAYNPALAQNLPAQFGTGDWSVATGSGDNEIDVTISTVPTGTTSVEYDVDGSGTWIALPGYAGTGTYTATMASPGTAYNLRLRGVNAVGSGTASASKSATSGGTLIIFHTQSGTGPYFRDPSNVPTNTTKIEYEARIYLASIGSAAQVQYIFEQESASFDLYMLTNGAGTSAEWRVALKDDAGTVWFAPSTNGDTNINVPPLNTWFTVKLEADQVAGTINLLIDGASVWSSSWTPTMGSPQFETVREITFLGRSTGSNLAHSGMRVEYLQAHFTTGGVRSLRKRVEGNAATVNADAWKLGGNAT